MFLFYAILVLKGFIMSQSTLFGIGYAIYRLQGGSPNGRSGEIGEKKKQEGETRRKNMSKSVKQEGKIMLCRSCALG